MGRPRTYSPDFRERAVRMVHEHAPDYPSQWAAIQPIATRPGCTSETDAADLGAARQAGPASAASREHGVTRCTVERLICARLRPPIAKHPVTNGIEQQGHDHQTQGRRLP